MSSRIRDPLSILPLLLVSVIAAGCELVLGDVPDNPVLDAGALGEMTDDARGADASTPDVRSLLDATHGDDATTNDVVAVDTAVHDTSASDTPPIVDVASSDVMSRDVVATDIVTTDTVTRDTTPAADAAPDRTTVDASSKDVVSEPPPDPCDLDHDGYRSDTCMGGNDCDDTTDQVYPGEPNFRDAPTHGAAGGGFDYNCSGQPELEFPDALDCSGLALLNCDETKHAFLGTTTPACGQTGPFGHCVKMTLTCAAATEEPNKIMRCK